MIHTLRVPQLKIVFLFCSAGYHTLGNNFKIRISRKLQTEFEKIE
jgi:hypothetical protein